MKKSWGLLPKILSGEKTIESRWYCNKYVPWDRIQKGDTVYFKNSGEPVTVCVTVARVQQFSNLTPSRIHALLRTYGAADGIPDSAIPGYIRLFKNKKYCILVHLSLVKSIRPFEISKKGFGAMAAWISVPNIRTIRI